MSLTKSVSDVRAEHGLEAALTQALDCIRTLEQQLDGMWQSRFFECRPLDDGTKKLWPVTAEFVSRSYDLADCEEGPGEFFYGDTDGKLYPVTIGKQSRHDADPDTGETPFVFASSEMVANNKVVGHVLYTDH